VHQNFVFLKFSLQNMEGGVGRGGFGLYDAPLRKFSNLPAHTSPPLSFTYFLSTKDTSKV